MKEIQVFENRAPNALEKERKKIRRTAVYCRVSTLAEEQTDSYETQCEYYRRLVEADPKLVLVDVYGDQGTSGLSVIKRPEFQRMMNDCMDGKIDIIMTKSISRFARNLADCVNCIQLLRSKGISVLFEKEGMNSADLSSELMIALLASMAQEEANNLSQNIRWSLDHRNASGNPPRVARYGYRRVKNQNGKKLWQIHEPEAKRIRLAFQMASQGQNYRRILMALNKMETAEGTGVRWLQPRVYQMLQSEVYRGDVLTNKSYRVDYLSTRLMKNEGQRDQYYIEDHHAAIIDKETFEQVGELIRQGALRTKDRGKCGK